MIMVFESGRYAGMALVVVGRAIIPISPQPLARPPLALVQQPVGGYVLAAERPQWPAPFCAARKPLSHVAGMTERIASGLRPHGQAMRLFADADSCDRTRRRVDIIDDIVEPAGKPELLSIGADVSHVGAAAARDPPRALGLAGREVDHLRVSSANRG